jgi:uncharacterized protein
MAAQGDTMHHFRGRFLWYELLASDTAVAKTFYTRLIGWGVTAWDGGETGKYEMWAIGDRPVGGMMTLPEEAKAAGAPPYWLPYVGAPDLDATARRAVELGATTCVPPTDIPGIGRFAVIADPQGAAFALFAPTSEEGPEVPPGVGEFCWHELVATDWQAAWTFYQELFGWEKTEAMDMGAMGTYQMYGLAGKTVGGFYTKPPAMPGAARWLLYISVPDVRTAAAQVKALGGQVLHGPEEVPGGGVIAQCLDPQGASFALHSMPAGC